jgi:5-methylcytosine-specific restriction endonuclease McrA
MREQAMNADEGDVEVVRMASQRPMQQTIDPASSKPSRWGTPMPKGWPKIRAKVMKRDGGRCRLCGAPASSVDHIVARYRGGTDDESNLRAICTRCHNTKTAADARAARQTAPRKRGVPSHPGLLTDAEIAARRDADEDGQHHD